MIVILSLTVPSIRNKVWRFVFLFVLFVLWNFFMNYVDVRLLGRHKTGWITVSIISLLLATYGTFRYPQPDDSIAP